MKFRPLLAVLALFGGCQKEEGTRSADEGETPVEAPEPAGFDLEAYLAEANARLATLNKGHRETWGLGSAARWDADQETGIITWSFDDGRQVRAPFQIIGTYSRTSGTFLWGWDHPSVTEKVAGDARKVLAFVEERGVEILQDRKVECSEEAAWELTALAAEVCERAGAYAGDQGLVVTFMTFGEVEGVPAR